FSERSFGGAHEAYSSTHELDSAAPLVLTTQSASGSGRYNRADANTDRSRRLMARFLETPMLILGERKLRGTKVDPELLLISCTADHIPDARAGEHPVDRNFGNASACFFGDLVENVDDGIEPLIVHRRAADGAAGRDPPLFGRRSAPLAPGEPSPTERAPDHRAEALIERERHQLPLIIAVQKRIITLIDDVAAEPKTLRGREGFHHMPAREVRTADIADFARGDQIVERAERLLYRRERVKAVHKIDIEIIRSEPFQAIFACAHEMSARGPFIVGT